MYSVKNIRGKGKGLVALVDIPRGTRILCEKPTIQFPEFVWGEKDLQKQINDQVKSLSEGERRSFLSLPNNHKYSNTTERYLGIVRTVALPMDGAGGAIFLEACRINHACDNNCQKSWNENIQRHTIHALRDIAKGEEITVYYLAIDVEREVRQRALKERFNFTCQCHLCSLPTDESQKSDERLNMIGKIDFLIGRYGLHGIEMDPRQMLRLVHRQVQLYTEKNKFDAGLPRAYLDAAQIVIANSDLARARIFLERAVAGWRISEGDDSSKVLQYEALARDPSKHELFGFSQGWSSSTDDLPLGLGLADFEDWLWKRKAMSTAKHRGLRNRENFPSFSGLPSDTYIGSDILDGDGAMEGLKPNHRCFLAEIVDFAAFFRLHMQIEDIDGKVLPLFFYTGIRGNEMSLQNIRKGHTVAILDARRHSFMFDEPGIRHEDSRTIKVTIPNRRFRLELADYNDTVQIIPASLKELILLSDRVHEFSREVGGLKSCHWCGRRIADLKKCSKCGCFRYCGKECQSAAWKGKDHKSDCKLLKDADLRALIFAQWDDIGENFHFPLPNVQHETVVELDPQTGAESAPSPLQGTAVQAGMENVTSAIQISPVETSKQYEIQEIPGKGRGLVAVSRLARGTRLLSEEPLFTVPRIKNMKQLEHILDVQIPSLDTPERDAFFNLATIHGVAHNKSLGITRTNLLPLGDNAGSSGIFLDASRINHSCRPNAQNTWNISLGKVTVHAVKDIEMGEEVTISYLPIISEYTARRQSLTSVFGFECKCELCSLSKIERKQSDSRIRQLRLLDASIGAVSGRNEGLHLILRLLYSKLNVYAEEGVCDARVARVYNDAFDAARLTGDVERTRALAAKAYDVWRAIEGEDGPNGMDLKESIDQEAGKEAKIMNDAGYMDWLWMLRSDFDSDSEWNSIANY